jgi:hypothetical protein
MVTIPADTLTKSSESITTPASDTLLVKSLPSSKETIIAADSIPTATKRTGSVAIAFSKKEVIENETLNVRPVKLISSELSAEMRTLKSDMIHFNGEVLLTRFWQLSPEVQQIMTVVDNYVNANTKNFKRLEKIKRTNLNDKLSATNERLKALIMVKLE